MPVNSTHAEYDASAVSWLRARDVLAGEGLVKAAGERYLPRLDSQSEEEYCAYRERASFFNATSRTAEGYSGLIFRRPPFVKTHESSSGVSKALGEFVNDSDMLGTSLFGYAKNVINEVIGVGRAGTLIDWEGDFEDRAYASLYTAEQIINWRIERVNGRNTPTLVVLREVLADGHLAPTAGVGTDAFIKAEVEQIRVLRLVPAAASATEVETFSCVVEIWQPKQRKRK